MEKNRLGFHLSRIGNKKHMADGNLMILNIFPMKRLKKTKRDLLLLGKEPDFCFANNQI
jgi:hypothetical protein